MAVPRTMGSEVLDGLKGWPNVHGAVDFKTQFSAAVLAVGRVKAGTVAHLNVDGEYALGVGNGFRMPIFLFSASDDKDVQNEAPDASTERGAWVPIRPTGNALGLPAAGAYELISTNFNDALDYVPNDALTSPTTTGGGVEAGMLTRGTYPAVTICGVVSRGVVNNGYGFDALAFWPVFLPAHSH